MHTRGDLLDHISSLRERDLDGALCMVVKTQGSTPAKSGATMIVYDDGTTAGTVGGGALEKGVIEQALAAIASEQPALFEHKLVRDHNMCCGGSVHVFIKPLPRADRLYIFGAGHVGAALAAQAARLSFDVTVIDDRPGIFDGWVDESHTRINAHPADVMPRLPWDRKTYAVIATYSHPLDREILAFCLTKHLAYCGMIGSARKVAVTRTLFVEQHWATPEDLDSIDMPIGLDIGAVTPEEIAVSIAARLVEVRRRTVMMDLSAKRSALHDQDVAYCIGNAHDRDPCRASS